MNPPHLRHKRESFKMKISNILTALVVCGFWGGIFGSLYQLAAGGTVGITWSTLLHSLGALVGTVVLWITYRYGGPVSGGGGKELGYVSVWGTARGNYLFWGTFAIIMIPIIMHGAALLLNEAEIERIAVIVFDARYYAMLGVVLLSGATFVVWECCCLLEDGPVPRKRRGLLPD